MVWRAYRTDLGRSYPMYALTFFQVNDIPSDLDVLNLLPPAIQTQLIEVKYPCGVQMLTPRTLTLFTSDGGQFRLNFPLPFDQGLFDFLTANTDVAAFEFTGERLKYGRLRRILENV